MNLKPKLNDQHKKHVLGALDHIDGILGDVMHQAKQHTADARNAIGNDATQHQDDASPEYEGSEKPGGHEGHPFGGKDQKGALNHHANPNGMAKMNHPDTLAIGHGHEGEDDEAEGASRPKFGGGKHAMWSLLNR